MSEHKHAPGGLGRHHPHPPFDEASEERRRLDRIRGAAPQLLEALELFVAYDESDDLSSNFMLAYAKAIDAARAAIAAATGDA